MKKRVLVTGANGQLGKTIQELYQNNTINLDFFFVSKHVLDITNQEQVNGFFNRHNFDYCINCAAYTNVEQAEKTPEIAYKINAEGVKNLANKCNEKNVVLIHISTDYVFDGEKESAYLISDQTNPINQYGKSKLLGEQHVQNILTSYFIIRTSWLYSKKHGNNFYKTILNKAKIDNTLSVTTEQKGCPTNTVNLSNFIIQLLREHIQGFGILHFCDEKVMTWYDFAESILQENNLSNKVSLVKVSNFRTFAKRPKNTILVNTNK